MVSADWPTDRWNGVAVMLGVSGGPDSVALLRAMHHLRQQQPSRPGKLSVLHVNHRWRAAESDEDEAFVADLCKQLDVPLQVRRSGGNQPRTEASARDQRYEFFRQVAEQVGARYVATAHTMDDQVETVMHRIIRGTGIAGLAGIRSYRPLSKAVTVRRPLLKVSRTQVIEYLRALEQPFREDSTNADRQFTRNRLRHELLPLLASQYNPKIATSLSQLGQLAAEMHEFVAQEVARHLATCVVRRDNAVELSVDRLRELPSYLRHQLLVTIWREQGWPEQSMGFYQWRSIASLIESLTTTQLPGNIVASCDGNVLRVEKADMSNV